MYTVSLCKMGYLHIASLFIKSVVLVSNNLQTQLRQYKRLLYNKTYRPGILRDKTIITPTFVKPNYPICRIKVLVERYTAVLACTNLTQTMRRRYIKTLGTSIIYDLMSLSSLILYIFIIQMPLLLQIKKPNKGSYCMTKEILYFLSLYLFGFRQG